MSQINDGGPAFPMSLRDYFAGQIATGQAASDDHRRYREGCGMTLEQWRAKCDAEDAEYCYAKADAMIAAREEERCYRKAEAIITGRNEAKGGDA